jgi:hypothetical protein
MLKVTNLDQVEAEFEAWLHQQESVLERVAIGLTKVALGKALEYSPQYSGDFAANWKLYVNKIELDIQVDVFPGQQFPAEDPFQRRDTPAIQYAIKANEERVNEFNFRWGDTIWLANSAVHEDLYAWKIEDGLLKLRPVNYGGEGPLRQTKTYLKTHFSRIDKSNVEFLR